VRFPSPSVLVLAVVCVTASPLTAAAGVLIVEKTTTGNGPTQTHQVMIEKDAMRVEHDTPSGDKGTVLFDGTKQVMRLVNYDKKTYTEMTKADIDAMSERMAGAMAQMQEHMKNLPPEQRARMEEMMRGRMPGGGAAAPRITYRKAGTDTVGSWTCDRYEGFQDGQKVAELCTVEPTVLGFLPEDFEVSRKLAEFFKRLMPQNGDNVFRLGTAEDQGFSGVPVKRVFSMSQRRTVTELTQVTREQFPASTFAVPAGFRQQPFGGGRQ
jgi:uncharacterized protein DUF4412